MPSPRKNPAGFRRLIHVAPLVTWEKHVRKEGLVPRLGHRGCTVDDPHEPRTYFFADRGTAEDGMANWLLDLHPRVRRFAIIEAAVPRRDVHDDPEISGSFYTTRPVPPARLRLLEKLDVGED
jgi:hypothetical protein